MHRPKESSPRGWAQTIALVALSALLPAVLPAQEDDSTGAAPQSPAAQFRAIIPAFHNRLGRPGTLSPLQLRRQSFVVFVYRNAVAVHSEAEFVNNGADSVDQEFALPSTGHDRNDEDSAMVSNGILSPRLWVDGEKVPMEAVEDPDGEWYAMRLAIGPGETRTLEALFWAETSLTDVDSLPGLDSTEITPGRRGFIVDIAHAGAWNDVVDSIGVLVAMRGGLAFEPDSFDVSPENYELTDSTIAWSFTDTEPEADDDVNVEYRPAKPWPVGPNTMARLAEFIVSKAYDEIVAFVRRMEED